MNSATEQQALLHDHDNTTNYGTGLSNDDDTDDVRITPQGQIQDNLVVIKVRIFTICEKGLHSSR